MNACGFLKFAFGSATISKIEKMKLMLKEILRQGKTGVQAKITKLEVF